MSEEKRIRSLIDGYCSGSLSEKEFEELEAALRERPEWRRELIEARALESDLRAHVSGMPDLGASIEAPTIELGEFRSRGSWFWSLAATIGILAIGASWWFVRDREGSSVPLVDPGVAVLSRSIDAEWESGAWHDGDSLPPGALHLVGGSVELEFYSGASVILEAPAKLELINEDRGRLLEGKLTAEVPPRARGFTITTPEVELVDLGTSFGMEVNFDGGTGVHVFDGEVELFRPDEEVSLGEGDSLLAGDGREIGGDGSVTRIAANEEKFLSWGDFDELATKRQVKRLRRWESASESRKGDDTLVAYYDFEPDSASPRVLKNRASNALMELDGSVIGATWEQGRWPGKSALDFKRPSDRVRINVPGSEASMTLVAWIRIDGFDNEFNSLLLSDGWSREGAAHWQLISDGTVEFSVSLGQRAGKVDYEAPFEMKPADYGRWIQVAVVYDGSKGEVTHYRDGVVIGRLSGDSMIPLEFESAEIGNWTPPARKARLVRNFNGRMDEMLIYRRALSDEQISALYQRGAL